jgi:hypothetical protein
VAPSRTALLANRCTSFEIEPLPDAQHVRPPRAMGLARTDEGGGEVKTGEITCKGALIVKA